MMGATFLAIWFYSIGSFVVATHTSVLKQHPEIAEYYNADPNTFLIVEFIMNSILLILWPVVFTGTLLRLLYKNLLRLWGTK